MAFIKKESVIGRRIILDSPVEVLCGTFEAGTEVNIIGYESRGYSIMDDDGNIATEIPCLHFHFKGE